MISLVVREYIYGIWGSIIIIIIQDFLTIYVLNLSVCFLTVCSIIMLYFRIFRIVLVLVLWASPSYKKIERDSGEQSYFCLSGFSDHVLNLNTQSENIIYTQVQHAVRTVLKYNNIEHTVRKHTWFTVTHRTSS